MLIALLASVAMQTQQPAANQGLRIEVQPANPVVVAQDTLRLRARVLDARGQPVPNAQIRFIAAGGRFEGEVEENGLLHSGSTGTLPVTIVAQVPGTAVHADLAAFAESMIVDDAPMRPAAKPASSA